MGDSKKQKLETLLSKMKNDVPAGREYRINKVREKVNNSVITDVEIDECFKGPAAAIVRNATSSYSTEDLVNQTFARLNSSDIDKIVQEAHMLHTRDSSVSFKNYLKLQVGMVVLSKLDQTVRNQLQPVLGVINDKLTWNESKKQLQNGLNLSRLSLPRFDLLQELKGDIDSFSYRQERSGIVAEVYKDAIIEVVSKYEEFTERDINSVIEALTRRGSSDGLDQILFGLAKEKCTKNIDRLEQALEKA
jgi:hypothetical protein